MSNISASHVHDFTIFKTIQQRISNDVFIEGQVEASLWRIATTISQPFKNVSDTWSIPYFAKGHDNYHGERGELRAKSSLSRIYRLCEYFVSKEAMIRNKYEEFLMQKIKASDGRITDDQYNLKIKALKIQLEAGDVSNRNYQRRITSMRAEVKLLQRKIWRLEDSYFSAYFPMSVHGAMRDSILGILDGRSSL